MAHAKPEGCFAKMCGIAGFTFDDRELIKKMCDVLYHRGPDDSGYYTDGFVSLGNTRLSIIDLETGHQPIFNEDRSLVIVHNGEIYNFKELTATLEKKGHRFYTKSDSEVIVHSFEEWGEECLKKFHGMFAFAIWDATKKVLFLARDRCGIKPLFYTILEDGSFIFSSEIKGILQYEKVRRVLDLDSFHFFINLRFLPKERTMFKGIKKLLPGHYIKLDLQENKIEIQKYWDIYPAIEDYPESYLVRKLRSLLKASLERHIVSDVPIGILLSGGIDSSTLVAFASEVSDLPVKTFTMGFGEASDELSDARYVSDFFGTEHHEIITEKILREYPEMIWYADMPKRNLYPYYVAKEVKRYVKVVWDGLGGDELFAGYEWKYQFAKDVMAEREKIPKELSVKIKETTRQLMPYICTHGSINEIEFLHNLKRLAYLEDNVDLYLTQISLDEVFYEDFLRNIYSDGLLKTDLTPIRCEFEEFFQNRLDLIDQTLLADFKVKAVDDFLFVEDAMSMANSVESRVPFLDNELVEFAFTIPNRYKFHDNAGKYILKKAMTGILPERVLKKEKRGFGGNIGLQFSNELYEFAKQMLPEGYAVKNNLVKKKYIEDVLSFRPSISLFKHYTVIWDLIAFEIWYRIYMLSDKISKPSSNLNSLV